MSQGHGQYFSPDGKSLRKAFIRAPVQFSRISSRFNPSRRHPVLNRIRAHRGVDYAAPVGTPVRAAGEGRVRFVGQQGGYGNVIELEHGSGVVTVYGHLSRFAPKLRRGQHVELGTGHRLSSARPVWLPARTCTTNTGSAVFTRIRRPSRCRTRNRFRLPNARRFSCATAEPGQHPGSAGRPRPGSALRPHATSH